MIDFVWVKPEQIWKVWPTILDGVMTVAKHADHWRAEDVYHSLANGASHLYLARADGAYKGFLVIEVRKDHDGPIIYVWLAYSPAGRAIIEAGMQHLHELASSVGASRILFGSPRPGWDRIAARLGFTPGPRLWEIVL